MRADQERRFVENVLMLMKHLESLQLSSWDSRLVCLDQLFFMGLRMDTIKVGSTLAERTTETSSMINIVPCVEILLRLAMALPHHYWQGISQHSSSLEKVLFHTPASGRARQLWISIFHFLSAELKKVPAEKTGIHSGMYVEARYGGRKAFYPARVVGVNPIARRVDLKYLPSFISKKLMDVPLHQKKKNALSIDLSQIPDALDDGSLEKDVPIELLRFYPETPRTPRQNQLQRLVNLLQRFLRVSEERVVEIQHFRRDYLPPRLSHLPPLPSRYKAGDNNDVKAFFWMGCEAKPKMGLYDADRLDGPLYNGKFLHVGNEK
jgi:hypothetical protein